MKESCSFLLLSTGRKEIERAKKEKRKICVNGCDCWMAGWSKSKTMTCWWNFEKEREPLGFALWFVVLAFEGWERGRAKSKALRPKGRSPLGWLGGSKVTPSLKKSPPTLPFSNPPPLFPIYNIAHPSLYLFGLFLFFYLPPTLALSVTWRLADVKRPKSRCTFQQLPAICSASQVSVCFFLKSLQFRRSFRIFFRTCEVALSSSYRLPIVFGFAPVLVLI